MVFLALEFLLLPLYRRLKMKYYHFYDFFYRRYICTPTGIFIIEFDKKRTTLRTRFNLDKIIRRRNRKIPNAGIGKPFFGPLRKDCIGNTLMDLTKNKFSHLNFCFAVKHRKPTPLR